MQTAGMLNNLSRYIDVLRLRDCFALLLASCLQATSLCLASMLLRHTNCKLPVFLALVTFVVIFFVTRFAVFVLDLADTIWNKFCSKQYLELALAGMFMGLALAADYASLQHLEVPTYIFIKAAAPVLTAVASLAVTTQRPGIAYIPKQLIIVSGVAAALYATPNLDILGLKYQICVLALEAVWRGLLAHAQQNDEDFQNASPLAIIANMAPIALLTLLSLFMREERRVMIDDYHRWKWEVFLLVVTVIVTALAQIAVILVRSLGTSTAMKAGAAVGPEIGCFSFAHLFLLSTLNKYQILWYVCAKVGQLMCTEDGQRESLQGPSDRDYMLPVSTIETEACLHGSQSDIVIDSDDYEHTTAEVLVASYAGLNLTTSCQLAAMAGCNAKPAPCAGKADH